MSDYTRPASADEVHRYRSGYGPAVVGAEETDHGLMVRSDRAPRWWANLWGGHSYTWGDEAEPFATLADVAEEYRDRQRSGATYFPCWGEVDVPADGETATIGYLWRHVPGQDDGRDYVGGYPDAILVVGPRGGVRVVPA